MKDFLKNHWGMALAVLLIFVLGVTCLFMTHKLKEQQDAVTTMTSEHAQNVNSLQNELKINKQNAEALQRDIIASQNATKRPQIVYTESLAPGESVVKVVQDRLLKNDSTLPPLALEKTDRTVVAEQPNNKEIPVGIYKINTYRNWELGIGAGVHDGDFYVPVSIQRNYSRNHSVEAEIHVSPSGKTITGGEVKFNTHF